MTWIPSMVLISSLVALGAAAMPMIWTWALAGRTLASPATGSAPAEAVTRVPA